MGVSAFFSRTKWTDLTPLPPSVLTLLIIPMVYVLFASLQKPHGKKAASDPSAS